MGRKKRKMPEKHTAIAGPEYFGLNSPDVVQAIEALPNAEKCTKYWAGKQVLLAQRGLAEKGENYGRKAREKRATIQVLNPLSAKRQALAAVILVEHHQTKVSDELPLDQQEMGREQLLVDPDVQFNLLRTFYTLLSTKSIKVIGAQ